MDFTVISCSLDPESRSRVLATSTVAIIEDAGHRASLIDLLALGGLPNFDNANAFDDPRYGSLHAAIADCDGVVITSPVYNWGLSSTTKNLIELTGATGQHGRTSAWFDKLVTFVCVGGLAHSYMAHGPVALAMMLDFKCVVNPHLVYATERDWVS